MNKFLYRYHTAGMITALCSLALGLLMIIIPSVSVKLVCYLIGAALLLAGIIGAVLYFVNRSMLPGAGQLVLSIAGVLLGLFVIIKANWVVSFMLVLLGLVAVLQGALGVYEAVSLKQMRVSLWWVTLIYGIAAAIMGIVIMCNPFSSAVVLTRVLGVVLLINGIADIALILQLRKDTKDSDYETIVRIKR